MHLHSFVHVRVKSNTSQVTWVIWLWGSFHLYQMFLSLTFTANGMADQYYFLKSPMLEKDDLVERYDLSQICVLPASLVCRTVHSFLRTSKRLLFPFLSEKNWHKLRWNRIIVARRKLKKKWTYHLTRAKTKLTILPW